MDKGLEDWFIPNARNRHLASGNYSVPESANFSDRERYQNMALSQLSREYSDPEQLYAEWEALKDLWGRESGWKPSAANPNSSARGIPQAMTSLYPETQGPEWLADPSAQISWGLNYIRNRYGSPAAALRFWLQNGWY